MKTIITLILSILITGISFAQTTGGDVKDEDIPAGGIITGELDSFNIAIGHDRTIFNWIEGEMNRVDRFVIELSKNGNDFIGIKQFICNGSESGSKTYSEMLTGYFSGTTHFRLATEDMDGNMEYSHVVTLVSETDEPTSTGAPTATETLSSSTAARVAAPAAPAVYPTLATGAELYLETTFEGSIQIFNTNGALVAQKELSGERNINISDLPASHYVIAFIGNNGAISTQRFIRQ